jgi:hypothetical protein
MKHTSYLFLLAALGSMSAAAIGATQSGFVTSRQELSCGKASYIIASPCKASTDGSLNACKQQTLTIQAGTGKRTVKLPEFTKKQASAYKKSGGTVSDLFVTRWGCVTAEGEQSLMLYHSIGGGSAPYSDAYTAYDADGNSLGDKPLPVESILAFKQNRKPVRSIMPD